MICLLLYKTVWGDQELVEQRHDGRSCCNKWFTYIYIYIIYNIYMYYRINFRLLIIRFLVYLIFAHRNVNKSSDSLQHVIFSGLDKYCIPQHKEPQGPSKSKPLQNEVKQENCKTIYGSPNCKSRHFKTVYCTK